uniref:Peptidyl-prolyl cis-trans isomerase n=1 Tax=Pinctada imbricata TaxID=66713 RepID=A0A0B5FZ77_PINIB|nr:cyclophilin B [Pinctada imbricata]
MAALFTLVSLALISVSIAEVSQTTSKKESNFTVTDEAWFEVEIKDYEDGDDLKERFTIALFGKTCPMTVLNFRKIVEGYKKGKKLLSYKKSPIHRIVPDFIIQMGDITTGDGTGGESIFGQTFVDENHIISHKAAGYVSMANHGPDSNGSQFFITLNKARWLDGKHVAFGKVINGMDLIRKIGEVPANKNTAVPKKSIKIIDCGLSSLPKEYDLSEEQSNSDDDI